ncbi:MAG TPA: hypothetical protein VGW78_02655 [Candidatus Babeliales bacterium]|jgi:hypothetical protein|nr:hypothetical protein [Candidatus Babeliales bacterium]
MKSKTWLKYIIAILIVYTCIPAIQAMFQYDVSWKIVDPHIYVAEIIHPGISINTLNKKNVDIGSVAYPLNNHPDTIIKLERCNMQFGSRPDKYLFVIGCTTTAYFFELRKEMNKQAEDSFIDNAYSSISRAIKMLTGEPKTEGKRKLITINNISNVSANEADWIDFYNIMVDVINTTFPDPVIEEDPLKIIKSRKITLNKISYLPRFVSESSENPFMMIEKNVHANEPITIVVRSTKPSDFIIKTARENTENPKLSGYQEVKKYQHFWKSITPLRIAKKDISMDTFNQLRSQITDIEEEKFIPITEQTNPNILTVYKYCVEAIQAGMADDVDAQTLSTIEIPEHEIEPPVVSTGLVSTEQKISPSTSAEQPSSTITEVTSKKQTSSSYFAPFWQRLQTIRTNYLPFTTTSWWTKRKATVAATVSLGGIGAFYWYNYMRNR